ncbi:MAG TPA: hypothetical protein VGQ09_09000 [Chitinophagaceae bacterium]|jgi:hypothetical protein|nr:hypothetical protein [Chitinophagaceae bacterium]
MKILYGLLLITCFEKLYGRAGQDTSSKGEKLKWHADYTYTVNPHDTAFGFYNYTLQTLAYSKQNIVIWSIHLPERMRNHPAGSIYNKVYDSDNSLSPKRAALNEIDVNKSKEFLTCPELISHRVIAISDMTGFLLLDKENGKVFYDIPNKIYKENFYVDDGRFIINNRNLSCSGTLEHGAGFISECDSYLFHFNGSELFIFNKNHRLIKRIMYNSKNHLRKSGILQREAFFQYKDYTVEITGRVFVN